MFKVLWDRMPVKFLEIKSFRATVYTFIHSLNVPGSNFNHIQNGFKYMKLC